MYLHPIINLQAIAVAEYYGWEIIMDKALYCHTVATETAKAFVSANMPQYIHSTGSDGFAEDFAKKYAEAYMVAENYYNSNHSKWLAQSKH